MTSATCVQHTVLSQVIRTCIITFNIYMPPPVFTYHRHHVLRLSFLHAAVRVWSYITTVLARYLPNHSWECHHIQLRCSSDKSELIRFWGQKVKVTARLNEHFGRHFLCCLWNA